MRALLRWANGDRQEIDLSDEHIVQPGGCPRHAITYDGAEFWILAYQPHAHQRLLPVYSEVPRTTTEGGT